MESTDSAAPSEPISPHQKTTLAPKEFSDQPMKLSQDCSTPETLKEDLGKTTDDDNAELDDKKASEEQSCNPPKTVSNGVEMPNT